MKTKHHHLLRLSIFIGVVLRCHFVSRIILSGCLAALGSSFGILHSQVPNLVSYQGRVAVGTPPVNFNGTGQFKFALYRPGPIATVWSNDGTSVAGSEPTMAVSLTVTKGLYSVLLGDTMSPIPVSVWAYGDLHLRVWFNDGTNGFQLLTPDVRLAPNGYLPDGSVSSATLADGAISSAKMAAGSVTSTQLAASAVQTVNIANSAIGTAKLSNGIVTTVKLADGAVTAAKLGSDVGLWSATGGDVYRGGGNVGIGTAAPFSSLTNEFGIPDPSPIYDSTWNGLHVTGSATKSLLAVEGHADARIHFRANGNPDGLKNFIVSNNTAFGGMAFSWANYDFGGSKTMMNIGGSDINMLYKGGEVVVGPSAYGGSLRTWGDITVDWNSQNAGALRFGGTTSGEYIRSKRDAGGNQFGLDLNTASTPRLSITSGGNVGIGTTSPTQAKLVVSGGVNNPGFSASYLQSGGGSFTSVPHGAHLMSIYASGGIMTNEGLYVTSDARIKTIESISDGKADLNSLLGIEITNYHFRDTIARGDARQKKVIAQQVEKVYPPAVRHVTDVVPDIYQKAVIEDGWIKLKTDLQKGERVRLTNDSTTEVFEVLEVKQDQFRTAFKPAGGHVFVYGREVKDFHIVDYDAISMLNVSATQQLARRLEAKDNEIAALKKQLADQAATMKTLAAQQAERDEALEARLARLEQAAPSNTVKVAMKK